MRESISFSINEIEYSKKLSETKSGLVIERGGERYLLINCPVLFEKEKRILSKAIIELKKSEFRMKSVSDIYLFLKNFCIENMILLSKEQREKILCLIEWESIKESILTPLLSDPNLEEIVVNGPKKPIMVYHKTFGWMKTNAEFNDDEKIKTIINKISWPLGRQISYKSPILNATLPDGSRINASTTPVAFSGINLTIRKFEKNPFCPTDLIRMGTVNSSAMALIWLAMNASCSILICGNTGSGKTTTLNSLFCFLPDNERIVVVEETPEILLPQTHVIKLNAAKQVNIDLGDLIDNTFRMRPDRVIVGEIRTKKEVSAFINTLLSGQAKGSYATFHAENSFEAIERLKHLGIEEPSIQSIDLIIVQKRLPVITSNGRYETRKITEICEIERTSSGLVPKKIFDYNYKLQKLERKNFPKRLSKKVLACTQYESLNEAILMKKNILEKMDRTSFFEFFNKTELLSRSKQVSNVSDDS